jgi:hypothetical protein
MKANFRRLTETNGLEIIVNPLLVRYLVSAGPGATRICFDNAHTVNVRGSPREIQQKLMEEEMEVWTPPKGD